MLGSCAPVLFVASSDLDRSRSFYEQALGLRCLEQNPIACVFNANHTLLRVSLVQTPPALPFTVLGWEVPDIEDAIQRLRHSGVTFERFDGMDQNEHGVWSAPGGALVAWFKDPDKNLLSLTQQSAR